MGDRLNFIIDHRLESVDAFDAILPIIIGSHIFHCIKYFLCPGRKFRSKTYCQSSRRLSVSETSLPYGFVVHINLFIACFVQASDDRLLKMRIDHHNQQLLRLINRLFPIIGTSLIERIQNFHCWKKWRSWNVLPREVILWWCALIDCVISYRRIHVWKARNFTLLW